MLGSFGTALIATALPAWAQTRSTLTLEAVVGSIKPKPEDAAIAVWQIAGGPDAGALRFKRGETVDVTLTNRLPVPVRFDWRGLDGNPASEPGTGQAGLAPGATNKVAVTFRHAGTLLLRLLADASAETLPALGRAIIVAEPEPIAVDREIVLLFEPLRSSSSKTSDKDQRQQSLIVNRETQTTVSAVQNERLRIRLMNGSQDTVIAFKCTDYPVSIVGIDSQPSEAFLARDGMVVMAPGARVDAVIDVTKPAGSSVPFAVLDGVTSQPIGTIVTTDKPAIRPAPLATPTALPTNGLPAQLDLKSATRIDLPLGGGSKDWLSLASLTGQTTPAFKIKKGKTVVIAVTNRDPKPLVLHLHGHHVRLLDRLDDGWKPFWLDTLAINTGQTQRIAFLAEHPGLYPIEVIAPEPGSMPLFRSYLVD
jgi:FtsP/CotA-like multicopper oxidase with cupredoxin domain